MNLAAEMAKLPEPPDGEPPYWEAWRHDLWKRAQADDPENFVNWPSVYHTMLVRHWSMDGRYQELPRRYRAACDALTGPLRGNCIEQAWHLWQWEQAIGVRPDGLDTVYELGAGYGAMAWLLRRLGFLGEYIIRDLPEFELLQRWWLDTQGVQARWTQAPEPCDLFIAIYSISEIPARRRRAMIPPSPHHLYVYSDRWATYDNRRWFKEHMDGTHQKIHDRPDWYALR